MIWSTVKGAFMLQSSEMFVASGLLFPPSYILLAVCLSNTTNFQKNCIKKLDVILILSLYQFPCATYSFCCGHHWSIGMDCIWWQAESFYQRILWWWKTSCQAYTRWVWWEKKCTVGPPIVWIQNKYSMWLKNNQTIWNLVP